VTPLFWIALALTVFLLGSGLDVVLGLRTLAQVADLPPWEGLDPPLVSVIVPARNEARHIEVALRSMLAQRYPALEFVAVDDRSEDATGVMLDRLAALEPRLAVVHVTELPSGWLGKNHGLWLGAARARGTFLLFADADVEMHPDVVSRAVRYAEEHRLDHLTLAPEIHMPGLLLQAFVVGFMLSFNAYMRPWKARDPKSRHFVGIGAFNLVRAEAYRRAGGHERIALSPVDDVKLGKLLKRAGMRQDIVLGGGMAWVEWYRTLGELVHGLEKNSFAALEYSVVATVLASAFHLTAGLGPIAGLLFLRGPTQLLCLVMVGWAIWLYGHIAHLSRLPRRAALLYPAFIVLFNFIVLRTMVLNLAQGGIHWRGTYYSLKELRRNRG
jgi:cellulose synthase/poly-beta-1,6-N-acetylglucosamine synthase-like glycosyltransferase